MMDRKTAVFAAMGFEAFGLIAAFVLIGRWLDDRFGTGGLGIAGGGILAIVAWVAHVLLMLKQLAKDQKSGHNDST